MTEHLIEPECMMSLGDTVILDNGARMSVYGINEDSIILSPVSSGNNPSVIRGRVLADFADMIEIAVCEVCIGKFTPSFVGTVCPRFNCTGDNLARVWIDRSVVVSYEY